jgi:hypothetical protein
MRHRDRFAIRSLLPLLLAAACARDAARTPEAGESAAATADSASAPSAALLTTSRDCGAPTALAEDGVGRVRIGVTAAEIRATCEVVRDTTAIASEGLSARTLLVRVGDDSVLAVVVNDRVQSISVETRAFRTVDGLGVGTPVRTLLAQPGVMTFGGEGNVVLSVPAHCGMSFVLPPRTAGKSPSRRSKGSEACRPPRQSRACRCSPACRTSPACRDRPLRRVHYVLLRPRHDRVRVAGPLHRDALLSPDSRDFTGDQAVGAR